jgi:hypothetical protein
VLPAAQPWTSSRPIWITPPARRLSDQGRSFDIRNLVEDHLLASAQKGTLGQGDPCTLGAHFITFVRGHPCWSSATRQNEGAHRKSAGNVACWETATTSASRLGPAALTPPARTQIAAACCSCTNLLSRAPAGGGLVICSTPRRRHAEDMVHCGGKAMALHCDQARRATAVHERVDGGLWRSAARSSKIQSRFGATEQTIERVFPVRSARSEGATSQPSTRRPRLRIRVPLSRISTAVTL